MMLNLKVGGNPTPIRLHRTRCRLVRTFESEPFEFVLAYKDEELLRLRRARLKPLKLSTAYPLRLIIAKPPETRRIPMGEAVNFSLESIMRQGILRAMRQPFDSYFFTIAL